MPPMPIRSFFDPKRVLPDLDVRAREATLRIRVSVGGDCNLSLIGNLGLLAGAETPRVIREWIGIQNFPTIAPPQEMVPLGFQRALRVLDALESWLREPAAEPAWLINLEPHGFAMFGVHGSLWLRDGRRDPLENRVMLHIEPDEETRVLQSIEATRSQLAAGQKADRRDAADAPRS